MRPLVSTRRKIRAVASQSGNCAAAARATAAWVSRTRASAIIVRSAAASAATSSGGTRMPAPAGTVSGMAPARVPTTGRPWLIASAKAMP